MSLVVFLLFMPLFLATPPLILGIWVVLLLRFGILGSLLRKTRLFVDPQKEHGARNKAWMILTIGVFSVFIILFGGLSLLLVEKIKDLEAGILGERNYSIVISFLYSPICFVLIIEAWLMLLSYFGLHYVLHRLDVGVDRVQHIKSFAMTVIQLAGVLTAFLGFGWWSNLGIMNQSMFGSTLNFSIVELSPITVFLTAGLVIMLFVSVNKISKIEENVEEHQQTARRMTIVSLSTLILLSLMGGSLSLLIHYDRSLWSNLG